MEFAFWCTINLHTNITFCLHLDLFPWCTHTIKCSLVRVCNQYDLYIQFYCTIVFLSNYIKWYLLSVLRSIFIDSKTFWWNHVTLQQSKVMDTRKTPSKYQFCSSKQLFEKSHVEDVIISSNGHLHIQLGKNLMKFSNKRVYHNLMCKGNETNITLYISVYM